MSKNVIVVMTGLSLGACSSVSDKNTFMTYEDLQSKVRAHEEQWQTVQPKLERIDVLEAELAALKQSQTAPAVSDNPREMNKAPLVNDESMAAVNVAPAVAPAPLVPSNEESTQEEKAITMAPAAPAAVSAPMAQENTKAASTQDYGVQVAAYANRDEAIRGWNRMMKSNPTYFEGLIPLVNQKEVKGRTMYQLKVGPFLNKSFSVDFCQMLKENGKDCLVTPYNGETFANN